MRIETLAGLTPKGLTHDENDKRQGMHLAGFTSPHLYSFAGLGPHTFASFEG